ncbi:hypothetical protein ABPG72_020102 [Tetrahymena utriculariae]
MKSFSKDTSFIKKKPQSGQVQHTQDPIHSWFHKRMSHQAIKSTTLKAAKLLDNSDNRLDNEELFNQFLLRETNQNNFQKKYLPLNMKYLIRSMYLKVSSIKFRHLTQLASQNSKENSIKSHYPLQNTI